MKLAGMDRFGIQSRQTQQKNFRSAAKEMAEKLKEQAQSVQRLTSVESVRRENNTMLSAISAKLMAGQELSNNELSYLRHKNPQTYRVALQAAQARADLRRKLKNAKTEEEVRNIRTATACAAASGGLGASTPISGGDQRWSSGNLIVSTALNSEFAKSAPSAAELKARKARKLNRKA